jgi:ABC-type glycerol-3-phosphate transport system permease component
MKRQIPLKITAGIVTALFSLPLYLALVNVFKTLEQIRTLPVALPNPFVLDNLIQVLRRPDHLISKGLLNSVFVTSITVLVIVFFSSALGFYIARSNHRLARVLLFLFVAGMLIPPQVTLIPVTRILKFLGMMGSFKGLILFWAGSGLLSFAVFVFTGFVKTIPRELDESAALDGASRFTLFWKIIFPLMRPATATVVIFLTLWIWNDFLLPLIMGGASRGDTITTDIYTAVGTYTSDFGQIFAMMFLSALPMLAFFFALQREFIAGLTSGALKG